MTTLLLTPRFTPDSNQIRSAAIAAGWEVVRREALTPNDMRWIIGRDAE